MITHLGCVMDGNRRWASKQGKLPWLGHLAGVETVEMVIKFSLEHKIRYLSLYTFSLENFNRSQIEQSYLFEILLTQAEKKVSKFTDQSVKIKFIGQLVNFPQNIQDMCHRIEDKTAQGTALQVNFLFGYGGRQEIFKAAQMLCTDALAGTLITQELFESYFLTASTPFPDLVIRTGGVQRLSNFLLYQSAYAEIRFLDVLWPDLTKEQLFDTIMNAVHAQKNLGK